MKKLRLNIFYKPLEGAGTALLIFNWERHVEVLKRKKLIDFIVQLLLKIKKRTHCDIG